MVSEGNRSGSTQTGGLRPDKPASVQLCRLDLVRAGAVLKGSQQGVGPMVPHVRSEGCEVTFTEQTDSE